jgi:hypothetical protein
VTPAGAIDLGSVKVLIVGDQAAFHACFPVRCDPAGGSALALAFGRGERLKSSREPRNYDRAGLVRAQLTGYEAATLSALQQAPPGS